MKRKRYMGERTAFAQRQAKSGTAEEEICCQLRDGLSLRRTSRAASGASPRGTALGRGVRQRQALQPRSSILQPRMRPWSPQPPKPASRASWALSPRRRQAQGARASRPVAVLGSRLPRMRRGGVGPIAVGDPSSPCRIARARPQRLCCPSRQHAVGWSEASGLSTLKRAKTRSLSSMDAQCCRWRRHFSAAEKLGKRSAICGNERLLGQLDY